MARATGCDGREELVGDDICTPHLSPIPVPEDVLLAEPPVPYIVVRRLLNPACANAQAELVRQRNGLVTQCGSLDRARLFSRLFARSF